MTPHFCPGSIWLCDETQEEHQILTIDDEDVVTICPPEPWKLENSKLLAAQVSSWHGTHQEFHDQFSPPSSAEVG
jgi:hypothetical protein